MKHFALSLILLIALPLQAELLSLTAWYSQVDPQGESPIQNGTLTRDIDFESENGYGIGLNMYWGGRLSLEAAVYRVEPGVAALANNPALPALTFGQLEMIPVTATVQFHLLPGGRIDPYVGAGVAYVLFDDVETTGSLTGTDLRAIDIDDDYGFVLNGGLNIGIAGPLAINLDAKYVPVESSANAVFTTGPGQNVDIEVNPLILSAGLSLRF